MTAGPPFRIRRFDGAQISYQGIAFAGSPREVLWRGYIEPFLENICVAVVDATVHAAKERGVDVNAALTELESLLGKGIERVYSEMARIDVRLTRLHSREAKAPSTDAHVTRMLAFLREHVQAERAMWKPRPPLEARYANNQF